MNAPNTRHLLPLWGAVGVLLVEAYRDDAGRPKQRTVATLGRLDQLGTELESVVSGLLRVTGKSC